MTSLFQIRHDINVCGLSVKDIRLIRKKDTGNALTRGSSFKDRFLSNCSIHLTPSPLFFLNMFHILVLLIHKKGKFTRAVYGCGKKSQSDVLNKIKYDFWHV